MSNRDTAQTSRAPKAVIFDIGRVIVRIEPERALEFAGATTGNSQNAEQLWAAIVRDSRWDDWQEGRMTPHEWHEHLTHQLGITIRFDDFCAAWNRTLRPETILKETLFERLGECCKLAVLSNTDPIHSEWLEATFSFLRHFPARIYSCRVGASKPSPAIYGLALEAVGETAADALYIDDIPEFAEAARAVGIDAICFKSPAQLARELTDRGLPGE
jgi:FMN phosphatase YigB (HAD superfamily)